MLPPPPKRLGRYDVGAKIAGGGMASVYLGRVRESAEALNERVVALKVVKPELAADAGFTDMFLDEARIIAQLAHPNIAETLEVGVDEGHRFIAMELLLGRTLADVWEARASEKKGLPLDLAAWVAARVAEALHYAHEAKNISGEPLHIIHRDVNPTNIILTYEGKVKLIDFGLVKAIGRLTRSAEGIVKGKVPYLSPEQATGATIDRRTDVYTLGITLWEITTGKRLFKREDDVATIKAIQKAEVPDPRKDDASYPDELWEIVQKALAVKPEERYTTANDLAEALNAFLQKRDASDQEAQLAKLMTDLFPGQKDKQLEWLADATTEERSSPNVTMPPPVPVADIEAAFELKNRIVSKKAEAESESGSASESESESDSVSASVSASASASESGSASAQAKSADPLDAIPLRLWVAAATLAALLAVYMLLARK